MFAPQQNPDAGDQHVDAAAEDAFEARNNEQNQQNPQNQPNRQQQQHYDVLQPPQYLHFQLQQQSQGLMLSKGQVININLGLGPPFLHTPEQFTSYRTKILAWARHRGIHGAFFIWSPFYDWAANALIFNSLSHPILVALEQAGGD